MKSLKPHKIAFISAVPFYYQVPFYRILSDNPKIDLTVYFCSDETVNGDIVKKMYLSKGNFTKENLLEGYNYKFLKNYSLAPSFIKHPFGLINFGIWNEIKNGQYKAVVLQAWNNITWFVAFSACLFFKTKIFFMSDSNILQEHQKPFFKRIFRKIFLRFIFKLSGGFLTSGTSNEEFYKYYGVSAQKMVRFPFSWGYEDLLLKSEELSSKRDQIRSSFGIKNDDFVILYVGRFSSEKSLPILLNSYSKIDNKNKKLFLVGDGPERKEIEKQIKNLNIRGVYIMGFQSRESVLNFYTAADILILPSQMETWGIVINEAMCFGLPTIASDHVGATLDLIKNNYNGFIFKAGSSEDLKNKIDIIINLKKSEIMLFGKRSKEIISNWVKNYNSSSQVNKMIKLINA